MLKILLLSVTCLLVSTWGQAQESPRLAEADAVFCDTVEQVQGYLEIAEQTHSDNPQEISRQLDEKLSTKNACAFLHARFQILGKEAVPPRVVKQGMAVIIAVIVQQVRQQTGWVAINPPTKQFVPILERGSNT
jgi:hypothetical protein